MSKEPARVMKARTRKRRGVPEDVLVDVPFIRVTPKKSQISLGRDALAVLGRPAKIVWEIHDGKFPEVPEGAAAGSVKVSDRIKLRVVAVSSDDEGGYVVSYGKLRDSDGIERSRPAGLTTVPSNIGKFLIPRRYWATAWSKPTEFPRWFEFSLKSTVPTAAAAASVPHTSYTNPEALTGSREGGPQ